MPVFTITGFSVGAYSASHATIFQAHQPVQLINSAQELMDLV